MIEENFAISNPVNPAIFKHFFDLSGDLLCIAGFDGYFKKVNPAVSKLLGYSEEELYDSPIHTFVYKPDLKITVETRQEVYKNKPLLNFENRYLTKKGEIVWLSWTSIPFEDEKLVYAVAKNVTHKKVLEEERNLLLLNFTKINKDLKKLSYTSSHDLRSPVNNLISIFSLLDYSKITDPETLEYVKMLELTSENLKDALNEYLDILIRQDHVNVKIEDLNLKKTLKKVLLSVNSLIENSNASISIDFSSFKFVSFNKSYLESIFLNLITNSIKYARPNVLPEITISSRITNGVNQLVFTDNGLGFNMKMVKDKIFGFNQKFHNHVDSKGIGLYLVHNHVISLGGVISVESELNQGTQFVISFKK